MAGMDDAGLPLVPPGGDGPNQPRGSSTAAAISLTVARSYCPTAAASAKIADRHGSAPAPSQVQPQRAVFGTADATADSAGMEAPVTWDQDRELVTALARGGVSRTAPEELPQFEVTARAFLAASARVTRLNRRDDPLGLGLESIDVLASTVALTVAIEVLKHLAEHYSDKLTSRIAQKVLATIGKRRSRGSEKDLPPLSPEQLGELHELAVNKACALQLTEEQATLIADGIVSELSKRTGPPSGNDR